ncbi:MAG: DUF58 domain-containing protein [Amaricoccus sp.]
MSAPGDPAVTVSADALMALARRAARPAGALAERPGVAPTRKRGQGHEIREIRPFTEGDDPRHLDAAATARSGTLQVRSFHEDRERTVLLVADFRRPMLWGTRGRLRSVAAAEALALAGWQAVLGAGAAGAVALTDAGLLAERPRPRDAGMARVAGLLARAHTLAIETRAPVRPLAPDLVRAARFAPRGAGLVLATGLDVPGPGLDAALAGLARRGPLRLLLVEDAFETAPPAAPLAFLTEDGRVARARFSALPEERAARLAALRLPGLTAERLATA